MSNLFQRSESYWNSPEGEYRKYEQRRERRFHVFIDDFEPLTKKQMALQQGYGSQFQHEIISQLRQQGKRAFRGGVCLSLNFETSSKSPGPIQTLTKNFLDLLGKATLLDGLNRPRWVLYGDDRQVQVLSVTCTHGAKSPSFRMTASPLRDFIADLRYVQRLNREHGDPYERDLHDEAHFDDSLRTLKELAAKPPSKFDSEVLKMRRIISEVHDRRIVQEHLLKNGQLQLNELADLYDLSDTVADDSLAHFKHTLRLNTEIWFKSSPYRVALPSMPTRGQSTSFRETVAASMKQFRESLGWLLKPLKTPIGLEVVVKPPNGFNRSQLSDLDNVVRDYLMHSIVTEFNPPSDLLHAVDLDYASERTEGFLDEMRARRNELPLPTKVGVVRYEVFRLPEGIKDSPEGYVTVNFNNGLYATNNIIHRCDAVVEKEMNRLRHRR